MPQSCWQQQGCSDHVSSIVIVGHGPSVGRVPGSIIDSHDLVVRIRKAVLLAGSRTDVIVSSNPRNAREGIEFWNLAKERKYLETRLAVYDPKFRKPSSGLSAAILARDKYPQAHITVVGFDTTLRPWTKGRGWKHDAEAEHRCLMDLIC